MTEHEKKAIIDIVDGLDYGEIVIKKEAGKIVLIRKTVSIKIKDEGNGQNQLQLSK